MFDVKLIAVDWWSWLIPAVFIIIYLLNHLLAGKPDAAKQREAQQRRRVPPPERPIRPQQAPQPGGQSQINAEIEQFLKRANERRMEKARLASPARGAPKAPPALSHAPLAEQALEIEPMEQEFDAVEESVRRHLGNRGFEQRAEHMGDDVEHADEEMEQHLKQVFDHRLGQFDTGVSGDSNASRNVEPPITRADPLASAKALAGLLANQENIRQAVLLKEILERPIDRW